MASEVSAPFAIRGTPGASGTTASSLAADSEHRTAIVRAPEQSGVTWERQQDRERPAAQETGKVLPQRASESELNSTSIAAGERAKLSQEPEKSRPSNQSSLNSAIAEMKQYVQSVQRDLQFEVDEESNRTIVRVVDSQTGDVVRQIPAEEFLKMAKRMEELDGLLMSERV